MQARVCYTTTSPCISCVKMLLCTGIRKIVFLEAYPHTESMKLWLRNRDNSWCQLQTDGSVKYADRNLVNLDMQKFAVNPFTLANPTK